MKLVGPQILGEEVCQLLCSGDMLDIDDAKLDELPSLVEAHLYVFAAVLDHEASLSSQ